MEGSDRAVQSLPKVDMALRRCTSGQCALNREMAAGGSIPINLAMPLFELVLRYVQATLL